jgi:sugar phosphate isomerase/epimerase
VKRVFISTSFKKGTNAYTICKNFNRLGINTFELSGGNYSKNLIENINSLKNNFYFKVHNYFPPPKKPFVINLASNNKIILKKSINHVFRSIIFAKNIGCDIYTFHAGFRFDPDPKDLGNKVKFKKLQSRDGALKIFKNSVVKILDFAIKKKIFLAIENNVVTKENIFNFKENPFLLTNPKEIKFFFRNINGPIGLLMDVGHFKVSSKTENFSAKLGLENLRTLIRAYHLSDNDGFNDLNMPFNKKSWFIKYLIKDLDYYSIEVNSSSSKLLLKQINIITKIINS